MPYKTHPFWRVEKFLYPAKNSRSKPHLNVSVLSHHIPKTAGSSLRVAFEKEFGVKNVYGIYQNTGASAMSKGGEIWLPSKAKVLHGHFKPHQNHTKMCPHAVRVVWVRDPLERLWSLIGHLLALKEKHPHYNLLKSELSGSSLESQEGIVRELILEDKVAAFTNAYSQFFNAVSINEFTFVGSKHKYKDSLRELSNLTGVELKNLQLNRRSSQTYQLPRSIKLLESYLLHEYEIVGDYL